MWIYQDGWGRKFGAKVMSPSQGHGQARLWGPKGTFLDLWNFVHQHLGLFLTIYKCSKVRIFACASVPCYTAEWVWKDWFFALGCAVFAAVILNEKIPDLEGGKHEQLFHPSERVLFTWSESVPFTWPEPVPFTWPGEDDVNAGCGKQKHSWKIKSSVNVRRLIGAKISVVRRCWTTSCIPWDKEKVWESSQGRKRQKLIYGKKPKNS